MRNQSSHRRPNAQGQVAHPAGRAQATNDRAGRAGRTDWPNRLGRSTARTGVGRAARQVGRASDPVWDAARSASLVQRQRARRPDRPGLAAGRAALFAAQRGRASATERRRRRRPRRSGSAWPTGWTSMVGCAPSDSARPVELLRPCRVPDLAKAGLRAGSRPASRSARQAGACSGMTCAAGRRSGPGTPGSVMTEARERASRQPVHQRCRSVAWRAGGSVSSSEMWQVGDSRMKEVTLLA